MAVAATIGFYFAGMSKDEANEVRRRLNEIAAAYGYTAQAGPTAGQGNAAALLVAIANGEVIIMKTFGQIAYGKSGTVKTLMLNHDWEGVAGMWHVTHSHDGTPIFHGWERDIIIEEAAKDGTDLLALVEQTDNENK